MPDRPCADRDRHSPHTRSEPGQYGDGAWCPGVDRVGGYPGSGDRARVRPPSPVPSVSLTAPRAPRDTPQDRIAAVLADLEHVADDDPGRTHHDRCWTYHPGCLAARVARTLRGER